MEFSKHGMAKYISHLDLQRAFSRAIRRSGLPVKFSQGFNPHYVVSFASALAVGIESDCECVEMMLAEEVEPKDYLDAMQEALPPGLTAKRAAALADKAPKLMAAVYEAEYTVILKKADIDKINEAVCGIIGETSLFTVKKSKGKEKKFDMRPLIKSLIINDNVLKMRLAAAQTGSLKPSLVLDEIKKRVGDIDTSVKRTALFAQADGKVKNLLTACQRDD